MAFTLPFGIRVAAGLLGTAIDRLGKLPGELPTLGVTLAGQLVKTSFRVRQDIAELATRGDDLLAGLTGGAQEHPAWATFDEDEEENEAAKPAPEQVVASGSTHRPEPARTTPVDPSATATQGAATTQGVATTPRAATTPRTPRPATTPRAATTPSAAAKPRTAASPRASAEPRANGKPHTTAKPRATTAAPTKPRRASRPAGAPDPVNILSAASDNAAAQLRNGSIPPGGSEVGSTAGPIGSDHTFSISELKERLQELEITAVRDLLNQEAAGPNRAAYLTLLANRLTTLEHQHR